MYYCSQYDNSSDNWFLKDANIIIQLALLYFIYVHDWYSNTAHMNTFQQWFFHSYIITAISLQYLENVESSLSEWDAIKPAY